MNPLSLLMAYEEEKALCGAGFGVWGFWFGRTWASDLTRTRLAARDLDAITFGLVFPNSAPPPCKYLLAAVFSCAKMAPQKGP